MTQRTINLYDGLEALYYFDSDYFDGTTGEIKDKSGHGRHATANGSVSVGVNGPNDFEAASFDGGYVDTGNPLSMVEQSFFITLKVDDPSTDQNVFANDDSSTDGVQLNVFNNEFRFVVISPTDGFVDVRTNNIEADTWYSVICVYDGTNVYIALDGEVRGKTTAVDHEQATLDMQIGTDPNSFGGFSGDIAAFGAWSRAVSDTEIAELDDLTAPRRTML